MAPMKHLLGRDPGPSCAFLRSASIVPAAASTSSTRWLTLYLERKALAQITRGGEVGAHVDHVDHRPVLLPSKPF